MPEDYKTETERFLNNLLLGEIAGLSFDAKTLIFLNPVMISRLAQIMIDHADDDILFMAIDTRRKETE